jgi:hypothetical protein
MNSIQIQPGDLTPAQWIQMMYPQESDWTQVDSQTLIILVQDFLGEQSCATSAIFLLSTRRHERATELAKWLLEQECADQWLKAAALDVLAPE